MTSYNFNVRRCVLNWTTGNINFVLITEKLQISGWKDLGVGRIDRTPPLLTFKDRSRVSSSAPEPKKSNIIHTDIKIIVST